MGTMRLLPHCAVSDQPKIWTFPLLQALDGCNWMHRQCAMFHISLFSQNLTVVILFFSLNRVKWVNAFLEPFLSCFIGPVTNAVVSIMSRFFIIRFFRFVRFCSSGDLFLAFPARCLYH